MRWLIKYFRENRKKVLTIIGAIAFGIFMIHFINSMIKMNIKNKDGGTSDEVSNKQVAIDVTKPSESVITGTQITNKKAEENADIISKFVNECNQKNYQSAYDFLSNDCKEAIYPDVNQFAKYYVDAIFQSTKSYKLELWQAYSTAYTYQIIYQEGNLLATGGKVEGGNFSDYITIVKQDDELKLNISNFIQKKPVNKSVNMKGINVQVNEKSVFQNYTTYIMTVKNDTTQTILMSDLQDSKDIILTDNNNYNYNAYLGEILLSNLEIAPGYTKKFSIKFNIPYQNDRTGTYIQFQKVYTNYDQYKKLLEEQKQIINNQQNVEQNTNNNLPNIPMNNSELNQQQNTNNTMQNTNEQQIETIKPETMTIRIKI